MAFTVNDFEDLIRILEQQPEWRARLRTLVLTDQLLALPEVAREILDAQRHADERTGRLEQALADLAEAQQRTERELAELAEAQQRTEHELAELASVTRRLVTDVDKLQRLVPDVEKLQGDRVERMYRVHADAYFGRIVRRTHVLSEDERWDLFDRAMERGLLSRPQVEDVALADALVRGLTWEDRRQVYLVVEASLTVGHEDVERAARRASLLARAGVEALAVVAGETVAPGVSAQAQAAGVWQVTDGRVVPPERGKTST